MKYSIQSKFHTQSGMDMQPQNQADAVAIVTGKMCTVVKMIKARAEGYSENRGDKKQTVQPQTESMFCYRNREKFLSQWKQVCQGNITAALPETMNLQ